jgi:purine-binding chemotaxis protein CheW
METIEHVRGAVPAVHAAMPGLEHPGMPSQPAGEFLVFRLAAEEYGIDILRVREIRSYQVPTYIANAPVCIKGVVNLRGVIVPILDLRLKFALQSVEYNDLTVVIILNVGEHVVGMVVDSVSDVLPLCNSQIRPVPELNTTTDTWFITGIGTVMNNDRERMLILVDIEQLITSSDVGLAGIGLT